MVLGKGWWSFFKNLLSWPSICLKEFVFLIELTEHNGENQFLSSSHLPAGTLFSFPSCWVEGGCPAGGRSCSCWSSVLSLSCPCVPRPSALHRVSSGIILCRALLAPPGVMARKRHQHSPWMFLVDQSEWWSLSWHFHGPVDHWMPPPQQVLNLSLVGGLLFFPSLGTTPVLRIMATIHFCYSCVCRVLFACSVVKPLLITRFSSLRRLR